VCSFAGFDTRAPLIPTTRLNRRPGGRERMNKALAT
jgi:hypothetical protein